MAETIAQAYVQILPSAEGIEGQLTNLLGGEADSAGAKAGSAWGNAFSAAGKIALAGLTAAEGALVAVGKNALESYADYEQLTGGIETLFKDSSDAVMAYAENAYQTAGLSANEYMETVTSFSAALIQSTGRVAQTDLDELETNLDSELTATKRSLEDAYDARKQYWDAVIRAETDPDAKAALRNQRDEELKALKRANEDKLAAVKSSNAALLAETEAANMRSVTTPETLQRAAELADLAITDMADNANNMGSSMESIQNAYQGFAKQNYTMLDNLKLGYGGTAAEMQRLLQDATAISGVEYDVTSYADVVEAIHVIQTEMGITGTTAEEASKTISGSLATMKAAWANLVTGIADENADLDGLIDNFVNSVLTVGENLIPRIEQIMSGMSVFIAKAADKLVPVVVDAVVSNAPQLMQAALTIVETIGSALIDNAPTLLSAAGTLILTLATDIIQELPSLIDVGFQILVTLADALVAALPELIPATVDMILTVVEKLTDPDTLMQLIEVAFSLIGAIATGLIEAIPKLVEKAPEIIGNLVESLIKLGPKLLECGGELIVQVAKGLWEGIGKIGEVIADLWHSLTDWFGQIIRNAVQWGRDLISNFIDGIFGKKKDLEDAVSDSAQTVEDYMGFSEPKKGPLSDFHTFAPDMVDLFDEGLRDNDYKLQAQLTESLSLRGLRQELRQESPQPETAGGSQAQQSEPRQQTVVLMLDRTELARTVFRLNNEETQRVGLVLTGGAA